MKKCALAIRRLCRSCLWKNRVTSCVSRPQISFFLWRDVILKFPSLRYSVRKICGTVKTWATIFMSRFIFIWKIHAMENWTNFSPRTVRNLQHLYRRQQVGTIWSSVSSSSSNRQNKQIELSINKLNKNYLSYWINYYKFCGVKYLLWKSCGTYFSSTASIKFRWTFYRAARYRVMKCDGHSSEEEFYQMTVFE